LQRLARKFIFDFFAYFCYTHFSVNQNGFKKERPRSTLGQIGSYLTIGLELALFLLAFIFIGRYLDSRLGTEPWLLLAGALLGFLAGFYNLIKTLSRLSESEKKKKERHS